MAESKLFDSVVENFQDKLWEACVKGLLETLREIVSKGADPHAKSYGLRPNDKSSLHVACGYGHVDVVKCLVEEQHCDVNSTTSKGLTSLHISCLFGHLHVVKYLVEQQHCNVNDKLVNGSTPLLLSCEEGHLDVVKYLVEQQQCDVNITAKSGFTPFYASCWRGHFEIVKYLVEQQKCAIPATEISTLHFTPLQYSCITWPCFSLELLEYLLKDLNMDPNAPTIPGECPLELIVSDPNFKSDQRQQAIRLLLAYGAKPPYDTWNQYLQGKGPQEPAKAYSKVFLMGEPGGGKSTLTKALETESRGVGSRLLNRFKKVSDVDIKTAGIVTRDVVSESLGRVTLYDLAGHSEFYASHDVALRNALAGSPSSIILLVVDLRGGSKSFEEAILKWCSFAENLYKGSTESEFLPFLIIVGSHVDSATRACTNACHQVVSSLRNSNTLSNFCLKSFIRLDCRYSESSGMKELRSVLTECSKLLNQKELLSFQEHCFLIFLQDNFKGVAAVTIKDIVENLTTQRSSFPQAFLPTDLKSLVEICTLLNKCGNILFLPNTEQPKNAWVLLQKDVLLKRVNGSIFAPTDFKEHTTMASDTGIIPISKLASHFSDIDTNLVVSFMCNLQFCLEVTDPGILQQLSITGDYPESEKFLFFPSLVTIKTPRGVWESTAEFSYQSAWVLQCHRPDQFFPSRFLHVIIHRLAFSFAMASNTTSDHLSIHRICTVWRDGIFWSSLDGVDTVVEITHSNRLTVLVGARESCELHAVNLRSKIISTILEAKRKYCSKIQVDEFFAKNECISYPLKQEVELISITSIAKSLVSSRAYCYSISNMIVNVANLLHFEPFADLGEDILQELFSQRKCELTGEFLARIADRMHTKTDTIIEILSISHMSLDCELNSAPSGVTHKLFRVFQLWRNHEPTYSSLCHRFSEFSVFAGRNPLDYI